MMVRLATLIADSIRYTQSTCSFAVCRFRRSIQRLACQRGGIRGTNSTVPILDLSLQRPDVTLLNNDDSIQSVKSCPQ
jgi:hypothetical protein